MLEPADDELIAACLRGEAASWDALIDRYGGLIYSIPLKFGLSNADAADVFQTVCLTLIEKLDTIRAPRGLAAWLITTTRRECLATARRLRRSGGGEAILDDASLADPDPIPEEELLALERQRVIRAAIGKLPANCRRLIEALFSDAAERATYQQLADGLGVPMNSLGPTRARCLERLRRLLIAAGYAA